jgi:flagellar motor switch/type III secretory pathway protein FliN
LIVENRLIGVIYFNVISAFQHFITRSSASIATNERYSKIKKTFSIALGKTKISLSELKKIDRADVLIIDEWTTIDQKIICVCSSEQADCAFSVALLNKNANFIRFETKDMLENFEKLSELTVPLSFEIGKLNISYGELQNLQAGYVFDLKHSVEEAPISVYANNSLIASGQLIAIGEKLAVKINQLF